MSPRTGREAHAGVGRGRRGPTERIRPDRVVHNPPGARVATAGQRGSLTVASARSSVFVCMFMDVSFECMLSL